jgi:hypothetical protein
MENDMPRTRRSAPRHPSGRALADAMVARYKDWREACYAVERAYRRWIQARRGASSLAYAQYAAALEREDRAAVAYAELVERVRRTRATAVSAVR